MKINNLIFLILPVISIFMNCATGELKVNKKAETSFSQYSVIQIIVDDGGVTNGSALGLDISKLVQSKFFVTEKSSGGTAFAGVTDDIVEAAAEKITGYIVESSK